ARNHLRAHEGGYSAMLSAIGVGALIAALLVASFGSIRRRRAFLGAGVGIASAALLGLSLAPDLVTAVTCCGLVGGGVILVFATSQGVFQLSAGDDNRGRVMGIYLLVVSGGNPIGHLVAGTDARRLGGLPAFSGPAL